MAANPFNIVLTDYTGGPADLWFLQDAGWLADAAVSVHTYYQKGQWRAQLTFAWTKKPTRFLITRIPRYFETAARAALYASYYLRTTQKDTRGTQTISIHDFSIHCN